MGSIHQSCQLVKVRESEQDFMMRENELWAVFKIITMSGDQEGEIAGFIGKTFDILSVLFKPLRTHSSQRSQGGPVQD